MGKNYRVTLTERMKDSAFCTAWEEELQLPTSPKTPEELDVLLRESMPDVYMGHYVSSKAVFHKMRKELGTDKMRIKDCKYAPQVKGYIDMLGHVAYGRQENTWSYDDKTYEIMNQLFEALKEIKPTEVFYGRKIWNLWITADRGPIEVYGDFQQMMEYGEVDTYEEYTELWRELYPDEVSWFPFAAVDDPEIEYRAIFLGYRHVIEIDDRFKRGYPHDISPFAQWLLEEVQGCLEKVKAGTYNKTIEDFLPPKNRTGTIPRRELWDAFPDWRKNFFEDFSEEELKEFRCYIEESDPEDDSQIGRISEMTANDFYGYCAKGYQANRYSFGDFSPKEWYYRHADGRDEGLGEIAPNSPEAFAEWYHDRNRGGGHPWEVCRGGNSTHVSLYVHKDKAGYYLTLAGSAWTRCIETIRFYLALKRDGLPVVLHEGKLLLDRMLERDLIGIVPEGRLPAYCSELFQEKDILDFINLPSEKQDEVVKCCKWQPEPVLELLELEYSNDNRVYAGKHNDGEL